MEVGDYSAIFERTTNEGIVIFQIVILYFIPAQFLHLFFPDLVCETAYELFYSKIGQHTSIGNYWNDPHHQVSIHTIF